jgi:hypothetical protein
MVSLLIVPIYAGVMHASSSSAAKIYIDMDIPEKKYHERSLPMLFILTIAPSILNTNQDICYPQFSMGSFETPATPTTIASVDSN